jgi:hypothetical protein
LLTENCCKNLLFRELDCRHGSTVEHSTCNRAVVGSIPTVGTINLDNILQCKISYYGGVPEWSKGTDCKSVGGCLRRFKSSPLHHFILQKSGSSSFGRALAFQAKGSEFEPRLPLHFTAHVAQAVEHILGKDEVNGSSPFMSTRKQKNNKQKNYQGGRNG